MKKPESSVRFVALDRRDIARLKLLWDKLNALHRRKSRHFDRRYARMTFEERMEKIFEKTRGDRVHAVAALDGNRIAGYCIASVDYLGAGEIDSLFVEQKFRGRGIGEALARQGLEWLKSAKAKNIRIIVAVGNEDVLPFYRKLGFLESKYVLEEKGT